STALVSHADPIQAAWILLNHRSRNELEMHRRRVQRAGMVEVRLEGSRLAGITHHSPPQGV
ncbi:MAG: hypothetical protein ACREP9_17080, partial [Candidatus Dormibacteraceae bacterium]